MPELRVFLTAATPHSGLSTSCMPAVGVQFQLVSAMRSLLLFQGPDLEVCAGAGAVRAGDGAGLRHAGRHDARAHARPLSRHDAQPHVALQCAPHPKTQWPPFTMASVTHPDLHE